MQNKYPINRKPASKGNVPAPKPPVKKPTGPFFSNELTLTFDYATRE